ncbi:hypothetical protein HY385_02620 [Candidatus Daviesbacteria bacterium]|nr:hypothetical protein [Candidatus Daviesbacteria bacterium]
MDILQISLVLLILFLTGLLSVLGLQVFFILKDLKKSLDKIDLLIDDVEKPVKAAAQVTQAVENGVKAIKRITQVKSTKKFFRRV